MKICMDLGGDIKKRVAEKKNPLPPPPPPPPPPCSIHNECSLRRDIAKSRLNVPFIRDSLRLIFPRINGPNMVTAI